MNTLLQDRKNIANLSFEIGATATIAGFLREFRNCGKLLFLKMSDNTGEIQVLIKCPEIIKSFNYKKESVLLICGVLQNKKSVNHELFSDWEILCKQLIPLSCAKKETPFQINELVQNISEDVRLQYRYLDLRRSNIKSFIQKRALVKWEIENFLVKENFVEIDTPTLSISTQEGAKTFNTPLLLHGHKHEFTLSQSPQLYKQILMISGFEKYFQFANVFRQEDLRKDRQYEFTQLDLELSYATPQYIYELIEKIFFHINQNIFKNSLNMSFTTMTYEQAYEKYGCDKPDVRFGMEFITISETNPSQEWSAHAIKVKNINEIKSKKILLPECDEFTLVNLFDSDSVSDKKISEFLDQKQLKYSQNLNINESENVIVLITHISKKKKNLKNLSKLRIQLSDQNLSVKNCDIKKNHMAFVWIVDWPLFEYNDTQKKYQIAHHLFTQPTHNTTKIDVKNDRSLGYDLVLNGVEIASGSVRNNDCDVQLSLFKSAGLSDKEIQENFGWFLETLQYGVPPHLGIAIGLDRMLQMLLNSESIRDVIAFPKNNHGFCKMTCSPKKVD